MLWASLQVLLDTAAAESARAVLKWCSGKLRIPRAVAGPRAKRGGPIKGDSAAPEAPLRRRIADLEARLDCERHKVADLERANERLLTDLIVKDTEIADLKDYVRCMMELMSASHAINDARPYRTALPRSELSK